MTIEVLMSGTWLYGGSVPRQAHILRQDWDYYHEPEDGDDRPELNGEGHAYYFAVVDDDGSYSRSNTLLSLQDALRHAESYGATAWDLAHVPYVLPPPPP